MRTGDFHLCPSRDHKNRSDPILKGKRPLFSLFQVPGPAIVWITMGNWCKAELPERMEKGLAEIVAALEAVVELRASCPSGIDNRNGLQHTHAMDQYYSTKSRVK